MKTLRIGRERVIAVNKPTFVVAEIGVNHDGSTGRALDLVRFAKRGGADAVKLQLFSAARLMHGSAALAAYQRERVKDKNAIDMLQRYELPPEDFERVVALVRSEGMTPLATLFSIADLELVE